MRCYDLRSHFGFQALARPGAIAPGRLPARQPPAGRPWPRAAPPAALRTLLRSCRSAALPRGHHAAFAGVGT
eukprot:4747632-Heterocapsa_arctica.AAC.1